jgi:hypothetical protein
MIRLMALISSQIGPPRTKHTLMMTDLYLIQLHGGPFDGYRQSVNYILLDSRLEMPGSLPCPDDFPPPSRPALYELRRASIELLAGLFTMVLKYYFVGMKVGMARAAITGLIRWKDRLTHRLLEIICGPRDARPPDTVQIDESAQPKRRSTTKHSN